MCIRDSFGGFVKFAFLEDGVEALDGADADLRALVDKAGFEALDAVELGEFAVIVERQVGHHFLLGLFAEVFGVDQKENALGPGVLEQPVDGGNGGVGLSLIHISEPTRTY